MIMSSRYLSGSWGHEAAPAPNTGEPHHLPPPGAPQDAYGQDPLLGTTPLFCMSGSEVLFEEMLLDLKNT